ncbi:MAG: precorrin-2 dehydrogenase/sirohydrochlorin ferrochelatase family protein [Acidimicrobiales bacterium]
MTVDAVAGDEQLYPVNLRIAATRCLVVGGGRVALAKVLGLLEAGASVTVLAPQVEPAIVALDVAVHRRRYACGDVAGFRLAIAATGDPKVNQAVFDDGEALGVWVNAADDPARCSFTLPARVRRGSLLLTVATGGQSPAVASWLRSRLEDEIGPEYEVLLTLVAEARSELRAKGVATEGLAWREALDSGMLELVREGNLIEAKERLQACLSSSSG